MNTKTLFCWLLLNLSWASCDKPCRVQNWKGTCIPLESCEYAMTLLSKRDINTLKSIFRGFKRRTVIVCCPKVNSSENNTTPEYVTTDENQEKMDKNKMITAKPMLSKNYSNLLPNRDVCGEIQVEDRIYGGTVAAIDEFPWMAGIIYKDRGDMFYCCGSLINNQYVLTAAHCVDFIKIDVVRLGEWYTEEAVDCQNGICNDGPLDVKVVEITIHPEFNRTTLTNDIALLRLEHPVEFTNFIKPICLPTSEYVARQDYIDSTYTTAGWGKTEFGGPSALLRKVNVDYVSYSICTDAYSHLPKTEDPMVICAMGKNKKDAGRGDSGGPLLRIVSENFKQNWYLYGITSFGPISRKSEIAAGYTRVSKYMHWIYEVISAG